MKLQNLKVGDKIRHYCMGEIVDAVVTRIGADYVHTEHKAVRWGRDEYQMSIVSKSLPLQYSISQTTPGAWYKGRKLQA